MTDLLLHPSTEQQLQSIVLSAPHALLITGARGTGKKHLAENIASKLLDRQNLTNYPYLMTLKPIKKTIGIESIREVRAFLGLKSAGTGRLRRVINIYESEYMTIEAQNALLKSLEEPPEDSIIILTTSDSNKLLPTILSRVQTLRAEPISAEQANKVLGSEFGFEQLNSSYYMSGGRASLLLALLNQKSDHPLVKAIEDAKSLLRMGTYDRLAVADELSKDKERLLLLLDGLQRVTASVMHQSAAKANNMQVKKFHQLSKQTQYASEALSANGSPKLVITNLILQM